MEHDGILIIILLLLMFIILCGAVTYKYVDSKEKKIRQIDANKRYSDKSYSSNEKYLSGGKYAFTTHPEPEKIHHYSFPYRTPNYDHYEDPYFQPVVARNMLKTTSDRYRYKIGGAYSFPHGGASYRGYVTSLDSELADNMGYHSVDTPWDNVGMVSTVDKDDNTIMSLDKRAIDPYREWYEYRVLDKTGIVIPLGTGVTYLEDGDIIKKIPGKEGKGSFKIHLFDQNKYVYV